MYLSELKIENFRMYGEGDQSFVLPLHPGLTALIGENDAGKTVVIDALRLAVGTRDQDFIRVDEADFHLPRDSHTRRTEIRIRCKFDGLTLQDKAAFAEYLTYEDRRITKTPVLFVNWKALRNSRQNRYTSVEIRSGFSGDGPPIDPEARNLLRATYLRPLRDAEGALSSGRSSRLAQILKHTKEVKENGKDFNSDEGLEINPRELSILGIGDYTNELLAEHPAIKKVRDRLNTDFLEKLSFHKNKLQSSISVSGFTSSLDVRLRQLLEKLELDLHDEGMPKPPPSRGLGSNNLLFMACELLLLDSQDETFPLLLIEEPEAHLHPQRQLRVIQFLQEKVNESLSNGQKMQIIITTHSPNLASAIDLDNLVLLHNEKAYPLALGHTQLERSDYAFLKRFLDVTKSNLFFAKGVIIVEGDAENILLPTLARLLGREFTRHGVSIVNVGGTGLRRFARIFQRKQPDTEGIMNIPVACIADLDVMPDCAPSIIKGLHSKEDWPEISKRRWRVECDYTLEELQQHRETIVSKASGQRVATFVADKWTLEYDLAYFGLAQEIWIAAHLADADEQIHTGKKTSTAVIRAAIKSFIAFNKMDISVPEKTSYVYKFLLRSSVSKATTAQYLSSILEARQRKGRLSSDSLRSKLPPYLIDAINYVTSG
ncbi:ATP-dependent endonuclease [Cohnella sp. GCM10012308]|uniref:ATP-dependent nuclease n=1 Tax=Cohnella sp. GCM10012308 TaxID=3317329 RepID=UPI00360BB9A8